MSGESNLNKLLINIDPVLSKNKYVFLHFKETESFPFVNESIMIFREKEGDTLIVKENVAIDHNKRFDSVWSLITLNVYSDLQTIGFLAAITKKLAEKEISVNTVSAYYHDHLFVPYDKRNKAMSVLKSFNSVKL